MKAVEHLLQLTARAYRRAGAEYSAKFDRPPFWDAPMGRVGRFVVRLFEKATGMRVPDDEHWGVMPRMRLLLGMYESDSVTVCRKVVRPGINVLDIGAHCGYYTRLLSDLVGQSGTVYAFEADPSTYDYLALNIRKCRNRNIVIVPTAVGDRTEVRDLFIMSGTGKHSLYDTSQELDSFEVKERIAVQTTSIDDFLETHGNPEIGFIKMDIEGAEPLALAGMSRLFERSTDLSMIVELHPSTLQAAGVPVELFVEQLRRQGFAISVIAPDGTLTPIDTQALGGDGHVNVLCEKRHGRPA